MTLSIGVEVGRIDSACHGGGAGRQCVHLLSPLPSAVLLARGPVERLTGRLQICPAPCPVIAAREGDILSLAFDQLGEKVGPCPRPGRVRHGWTFLLHHVDDDTVFAVRREAP